MNIDERLPVEVLQDIFGKITEESTSIVQSCCCSQALLNENTGVYGCRLLEDECPFEIPDPMRCRKLSKFSSQENRRIYLPHKTSRRNNK